MHGNRAGADAAEEIQGSSCYYFDKLKPELVHRSNGFIKHAHRYRLYTEVGRQIAAIKSRLPGISGLVIN